MNRRRIIGFLALVVSAAIAASCATTTITKVWKEESFQGPPIANVFVIGLIPDAPTRRIFEDEVVRQLRARGITATAGYPTVSYENVAERASLAAQIKSVAADAVLVARFVKREVVTKYIPTAASPLPYDYYYDLPTFVLSTSAFVEPPPELVKDDISYIETNIYSARTDKLIWTALSETWMIERLEDLIRAFSKTVIDRLVSDRIIR